MVIDNRPGAGGTIGVAAVAKATPDVRERFATSGTEPLSMSQIEFARFVRAEIESAARVVKAAGIKAE